jgi:transcriptional regulator with XRE-family HTH domain
VKKAKAMIGKRNVTPMDRVLGTKVRARRIEMHLSQSDLADALGVSFQQVQKYEKGVNRIGSSRLMQIAQALKTDTGYFFAELNGNLRQTPSKLSTFMATKDGLDIVEAMMKLNNPELRRSVILLARKLGDAYEA